MKNKAIKKIWVLILLSGMWALLCNGWNVAHAQESKPTGSVVFAAPEINEMWVGHLPVTVLMRNIDHKQVRLVEFYLDGRLIREFKDSPYAFSYDFGMNGNNRTLKVVVLDQNLHEIVSNEIKSFQADDLQAQTS